MNASFVQAAPFLWLLLAVALEIGGTYLLKLSDGMTRRAMGAGGVVLVLIGLKILLEHLGVIAF